jgi:hypothetical protein
MGQWGKFFVEGGKKLGATFTVVEDDTQKKEMEKAGFVDIHEFEFKVSLLPKRPFLRRGLSTVSNAGLTIFTSVLSVDGRKILDSRRWGGSLSMGSKLILKASFSSWHTL